MLMNLAAQGGYTMVNHHLYKYSKQCMNWVASALLQIWPVLFNYIFNPVIRRYKYVQKDSVF